MLRTRSWALGGTSIETEHAPPGSVDEQYSSMEDFSVMPKKVYAGHEIQLSAVCDDPLWYCPKGQTEQLPTAGSENDPAIQTSHAPDPGASLYVPASHAVQGPPSGPVYPGSQVQCCAVALRAGAELCSGHVSQLAAPAAA
eukprot:3941472-Rhodomonas_salina.1